MLFNLTLCARFGWSSSELMRLLLPNWSQKDVLTGRIDGIHDIPAAESPINPIVLRVLGAKSCSSSAPRSNLNRFEF